MARRKRVQDAFDDAVKIMNNAQSPDGYRMAITAFGSIDSIYQDINSLIKNKIAECEQKIHQIAVEAERKRKAAEEVEEAARRKRVQDAFDNAVKIMNNAKRIDDYRNAIKVFYSIAANYQDINSALKEKMAECEKRIEIERNKQERQIIVTGRTIDQAIESGVKQLNMRREDMEFEIIELPKKSLFSFTDAKVRIWYFE